MTAEQQPRGVRQAIAATPGVTAQAVVIVLLALGTAWLVFELRSILVLAFLAVILAAGALGPSRWLEERGLPRPVAVVVVYLGVLAIVALILFLIVPPLIAQVAAFASQLPALLRDMSERYGPALERLGLPTDSSGLVDLVLAQIGGMARTLSGVPFMVAALVGNVVTVIFLSALLLLERDRARDWGMRFVAPADRNTLSELVDKAAHRLGAYIRGQLLIMSVTGTASAIGLTLLGVPFALPLGFLAFLTEAIPLAGPILAGVVMVAVALLESPGHAVATAILVFGIQQLEGFVLIPVVQGRVISISPVVALLAVLSGSALGGIVGAIIAIPIVAIATVVIDDVVLPWRRRQIQSADRPASATADESEGPAP